MSLSRPLWPPSVDEVAAHVGKACCWLDPFNLTRMQTLIQHSDFDGGGVSSAQIQKCVIGSALWHVGFDFDNE